MPLSLIMRSISAAMLAVVAAAGLAVAQDPPATSREQALVAVLRSETPEAEKALAFKGLAIHGSPACIGDVASYLGNERLASWARITLEAIPGDDASAALRAAAAGGKLSGRLLVGVINSLGVRHDAAAVPLLATRLGDADAAVAAAAAAALGTIGTPAAATLLSKALAAGIPDRDLVAEACVVCGERLMAAGDAATAVALFQAVRAAEVSEQRRAEATRAAILAQGRDGIPLLVDLLKSAPQRLFNMGLFTARELAVGPDRDPALAYEVDRALLEAFTSSAASDAGRGRRPLLIDLLADRNATGASAAVQKTSLGAARGAISGIWRRAASSAMKKLPTSGMPIRADTLAAPPPIARGRAKARSAGTALPSQLPVATPIWAAGDSVPIGAPSPTVAKIASARRGARFHGNRSSSPDALTTSPVRSAPQGPGRRRRPASA